MLPFHLSTGSCYSYASCVLLLCCLFFYSRRLRLPPFTAFCATVFCRLLHRLSRVVLLSFFFSIPCTRGGTSARLRQSILVSRAVLCSILSDILMCLASQFSKANICRLSLHERFLLVTSWPKTYCNYSSGAVAGSSGVLATIGLRCYKLQQHE